MFCQQWVTIFLFKAIIVTNVRAADVLSAVVTSSVQRLHQSVTSSVQRHHRY